MAVVLCSACALVHGRATRPAAPGSAPVALVLDGSAVERPASRRAVVAAIERVARRRVVVVPALVSLADPDVMLLAARVARENTRLAAYDWREPQCAAAAPALTAAATGAAAVYHVSLARTERWRTATERELGTHAVRHAARKAFASVRAVQAGVVLEDAVSGTVALSTFDTEGAARRVTVARRASLVEPTPLTPRVHAGPLVAEVVRALPLPGDPDWDAVARRLVHGGCPFLALAVAETRAGDHGELRTLALGAMRRQLAQRAAGRLAAETSRAFDAAVASGRLDVAASIVARYAARPDGRGATVRELRAALEAARRRAAPDVAGSCSELCAIHMVEICNRDRALWESNRHPWEQTACGTRRAESFLRDCYQQQWLNGAFHETCMAPCQDSAEGRERLIGILRGAGCRVPVS